MSINGRNKGKAAEREFFNKMNELLGYEAFQRNLQQTRGGGEDGDTELPVSVEVKRQEKLSYPAAIKQAKEQADKAGKLPVLAHRRNREDWNVMVILTPEQFAKLLIDTHPEYMPALEMLQQRFLDESQG